MSDDREGANGAAALQIRAYASGMVLVGAHTDGADPPSEARNRHADLIQIFLGDPQGWAKPSLPPGAENWRESGVPL